MFTALLIDFARLSLWLVLLAVIFIPLERLFALHPSPVWRRGVMVDIGYYFLNSLLPGFILGMPLAGLALAAHHFMPWSFQQAVGSMPFWMRLVAGLVVGEIGFYWGHRWTHEVPFLWQFHSMHHEPEHIDWLVNTRTHPVDMVFTRLCGLVPLYILGLGGPTGGDSVTPALVVIIGTIWGFFIHANVTWRFGALEEAIATPAFHHWHHVVAGPINRNYAAMLPVLDRIFGTFHAPRDAWPHGYGIMPVASPTVSDPGPSASRPETSTAGPASPMR